MSIRPIGCYVHVIRETTTTMTAGGLHIPDSAQKKVCRGEVQAAGPGYYDEHGNFRRNELNKGDKIIWDRMGSYEVPDAPDQVIVSQEYILGKLEATEPESDPFPQGSPYRRSA